jgi:hypothetical protein
MTVLTNRWSEERRLELQKRLAERKKGQAVTLFLGGAAPPVSNPSRMPTTEEVKQKRTYNPVGANTADTRYKGGGCCGH